MEDKLVTIATFGSSAEAHAARLALDGEGIEAKVGDDAAADMLSIMGVGLGGAKLLVWQRDERRAREILEQHAQQPKSVLPAWICHECGSTVDAGFEVCWSCGAEYSPEQSEPAPAAPQDEAERHSTTGGHLADEADESPPPLGADQWRCPSCGLVVDAPHTACPACGAGAHAPPNPYLPARASNERSRDPVDDRPAEAEETTETLSRAWRTAILGIVVCPGILHLYSMCLLARVAMSGERLSSKSNRRFYVTLAIDVLFPLPILLYYQIMSGAWSFLGTE